MKTETTAGAGSRPVAWHLLIIALLVIGTHGPMLLMDGDYWDGRLLHSHLSNEDWPILQEWFDQAGLMGLYEFHRALGAFPDIVLAYRASAFLAIGLCAILVFLIGYKSRLLSPTESLFVALIQLTFPAFRTSFSLILLPYLVAFLLFLLGAYVAVRSYYGHGWTRYLSRVMSLVLFFFSYTTNSLLVFHFGFILFMIVLVRRVESLSAIAALRRYVVRNVDFVVLPAAFWAVKELFFPRHGWYEGYNRIELAVRELGLGLVQFTANAVVIQMNETLVTLLALPVIWLLIVAVTVFAYTKTRFGNAVTFESPTSASGLVLFGVILLLLAMAPYALVRKIADVYGFETRFSVFISLGVGVVVVGVIKALFRTAAGRITHAGVIALVTLILAFSVSRVGTFVHWQARWVKDRSIELHLRNMPPSSASTYLIDEEFPLAEEVAIAPYLVYDWSCMFEAAWGGETRAGLTQGTDVDAWWTRHSDHPQFARIRNIGNYDPNGTQAQLIIRAGPRAGGVDMVLWYWWYRYVNPRRLESFVRDVTVVTLREMPE
jgi:hypothetical protein